MNYSLVPYRTKPRIKNVFPSKPRLILQLSSNSSAILIMKSFGAFQLVGLIAAVASAQNLPSGGGSTHPTPGPPQKAMVSGDPTPFQLSANQSMPTLIREDLIAASGRIEVHWKFSPAEGNTGGLWVQFYSGANPNPGQQYSIPPNYLVSVAHFMSLTMALERSSVR